nr:GGDEF and EAL domain-containing protein [Lichenibacterium sp. 6Y81]
MCIFARDGLGILAVNDAALDLYGYDRAAFLALSVGDLQAASGPATGLEDLLARPSETLWSQRRLDGSTIVTLPYIKRLTFLGHPAAMCCVVDVTARNAIADELRQTRAFLHSVVEAFPAAVFVKDLEDEGRYVLMNRSGGALLNLDRGDVIGKNDADLFSAGVSADLAASDAQAIESGLYEAVMDVRSPHREDDLVLAVSKLPIPSETEAPPRFLLSIGRDITEQRRMEERLTYLAHHDVLTGLPNRVLFQHHLDAALRASAEGGVALLSIDLDGFKNVNDAFGHPTGDALLAAIGGRLRAVLSEGDTGARLGGDEFAVIHRPGPAGLDPDSVERLATRIIAALVQPYEIDGRSISIGATVGIAKASGSDTDPEQLLRQADLALYHGKGTDKGTVQHYRPGMDERCQSCLLLERDLAGALELHQFELYYQPMVDLTRDRICGFEALLRWHHPELGTIPPSDFIPLLEDSGAIAAVGAWVLHTACREAATWPAEIKVAVNLSPAQFRQQGLLAVIINALAGSGLDPGRLELEITESVLLHNNDANLGLLHQIRAMGVLVSLDDFGTGYSSLSYVRCFPFSKIKVDRSFVAGLGEDAGCLAIVRAVSRLATDLCMVTTAEGIETPDQLRTVRQEGCSEGQGYLFGRPMPGRNAAALLEHQRSVRAA